LRGTTISENIEDMPNDPTDLGTGNVTISESEADSGKYLLLKVPDFATDPSGNPDGGDRHGEGMTSYLRLGAKTSDEKGDDLIQYAFEAGAVGFDSESEPSTIFIDDQRNRGDGNDEPAGAAGHGMSKSERYERHTKHLESKGGWRDHSDGNRITTTYGDKLEVIRGNYKLMVMGRQDDPENSQGHEWSGNHVQDWGQGTMPGASTTLEWIRNGYVPGSPIDTRDDKAKVDKDGKPVEATPGDYYRGGAWLLINSTERVYQYSRNAGNFREQQWGDKLESYTGSEDPERIGTTEAAGYKGHPTAADIEADHNVTDKPDLVAKLRPSSKGLPRGNPHIIEKTWASKIESYTGSSALRIPSIHEETWAESMNDKTDCSGKITSSTKAQDTDETTDVSGTASASTTAGIIAENTNAGLITENTNAGLMASATNAGAIFESTIAGAHVEFHGGLLHSSIELGGVIDLFIGLKLDIDISGTWELTVREHKQIRTKKQKLALAEEAAALDKKEAALQAQLTFLTNRTVCLLYKCNALAVELGL
jgi:hypothetical protein